MLISSYINNIAHNIRRAHKSLTWGQAFRTAVMIAKCPGVTETLHRPSSLYGTWNPKTVRAIAGHFWALKCLYRDSGDLGRSAAFGRVAQALFAAWEGGYGVNYQAFISQRGVGASVINELVDYYCCAVTGTDYYTDHTNRIMGLLATNNAPLQRVNLPTWTF